MASETTVPDQSTTEQHVEEKKVNESVKNVEQETASQSKDVVEESEKPKMEEPADTEAVVAEPEKKTEDKDVTTPAVVEVETVEEVNKTLSVDVPVQTDSAVVENSEHTPVICAVPETPAEEPSIEPVVEKLVENSEATPVTEAETQVVKEPGEVSESAAVVETPADHSEVCAVPEPVPEAENDPKEQSVPEVEEKAEEKSTASDVTGVVSEVTAEFENRNESLDAKEGVENEAPKDEVTTADNTEVYAESLAENCIADSNKIKVETSVDQGVVASQISDAEVPGASEVSADEAIVGSAAVIELGEAGGKSVVPDVIGTVKSDSKHIEDIDNTKKEGSQNVGEESVKKAAEVAACGIAEKSVKTEVNFEKEEDEIVKTDEPAPTEAAKTELNGSVSASEVTDNAFGGEKTSRDVEMVTEERENVENEVETSKNREVEVGKDIMDMPLTVESVVKSSEMELEAKVEKPAQTDVSKLEKEEEKNIKAEKSDRSNLAESMKEINDAKQEVPTKKQSTSIMSKVKQSMGKVKKAIIGKSPSSKTISVSAEAKDEIKVK